jgi:hypothetical protein
MRLFYLGVPAWGGFRFYSCVEYAVGLFTVRGTLLPSRTQMKIITNFKL